MITRTSESLEEVGMTSVALKDYPKSTFNGFSKRLRLKKDSPIEISPLFIGYLLRTRFFRKSVANYATMTTRASLNGESIQSIPLLFPPLNIQEEIGKTLHSLDQKITLLRQQNQDLEELAQTIFKRWFVEFEFPCLPSSYRPQGQVNLSSLAKVCTYKRVGGLPVPDGKSWFTYVLLCEDGSFYKGMTNDLYRRFYEHYIGEGANHTKTHKPVKVIHWEQFDTQEEARKREEELKTGYGRTWLQREYDKLLKYGSVASDGLPAQNEGSGLPAHQTRLMTAGKMVDSELGEIPEGWRVGKLGDIYKTTSGGTPSRQIDEFYNSDGIPWIKSKELENIYVIETEEYISEEGLKKSSAKLLPKDTILVAMYGATVGQLSLTSKDNMTCNQAICAILEGEYSFPFCYLLLKNFKKDWTGLAIGSAQQNLSQVTITGYEIIIPSIQIERNFTKVIKPIYNSIKNNFKEIQTLTQLRDTLLPKLMSGELRVNDNKQ